MPSTTITSIKPPEKTGRRTQTAASHCILVSFAQRTRCPLPQPRRVDHDDSVADVRAAFDADQVPRSAEREHPFLEALFDDEERAGLSVSFDQRGAWDSRQRVRAGHDPHVGEHAGFQGAVRVRYERLDHEVRASQPGARPKRRTGAAERARPLCARVSVARACET